MGVPGRVPLFVLGALSLITGLAEGLARLGWTVPVVSDVSSHGPLMVSGFLGTVIGLERAVALRRSWPYLAPISAGLGGVASIAGLAVPWGAALFSLAALVLATAMTTVVLRQRALFTVMMWLGAISWLAGNLAWLAGWPIPDLVLAWAGFLVLTIAGERVELSRFLPSTRLRGVSIWLPLALTLAGLGWALADGAPGPRLLGAGLITLTAWLVIYDIARRTVRTAGLPRYSAICLLSGYVWLGAAGVLLAAAGLPPGGAVYDAVLHALFIGFVFAMVFGHAPMILPAVLGLTIPMNRLFYLWLGLLHVTLALRLAGDFWEAPALRLWGGLGNAAVIVGFLLSAAIIGIRQPRAASRGTAGR